MKKLLFMILFIISLFVLSCNHNKSNSSLTNPIGKVGEITVNPLGVTPLSAVYTTASVNAVPITVTVKGLYGEPDIIHTYPAGYGTEFEIHGMFPESHNTIIVNDGGRTITKNIYIGTLSTSDNITIQKKYDVEINELNEEKYPNNPDLYIVMSSIGAGSILGISPKGYIRYFIKYYGSSLKIENKMLILHSNNSRNVISLIGKIIKTKPTNIHHDTILKNDNYIYLSTSTFGSEDKLIEIDNLGNIIRNLSFSKLIQNSLDLEKYPEDEVIFKQIVFGEDVNNIYIENGHQQSIDWFHANSLVYDSETDILYVSSRHRGVLAINYSEWKLIWWMADKTLATKILVGYGGIPYNVHFKDLKSLEEYRVKGDAINDGPKNQHALFLLENGNLGMFDNQGDEDTNPNGSRYVEYQITGIHGNYQAKKVYEYRDPSLYSRIISDVDFTYDNYNNLLIAYGDPEGKILEIEKNTKKILFKFVTFRTYRVDKMPLYYDEGRVYSEDCNLKNSN